MRFLRWVPACGSISSPIWLKMIAAYAHNLLRIAEREDEGATAV